MNRKLMTAGLVAAALIAPLASHAAGTDGDADRKAPGAFVKDSVITTKIKSKLAAEKPSTLAKIHVDTDANGMVVLTGTARDATSVARAAEIARSTEGVKTVQNNIKVKADD